MTWQDELTRLDEELAAGRLSAEDYRRRRDELLAQDPAAQTDAGTPGPFPPAFRWETTPPSDNTQVMQPVEDDEPERTQVLRGDRAPTQPAASNTGDDSDRTQVVSAGPQQTYPEGPGSGGFPAHGPAQAQPQSGIWDDSAPPWASTDLPPIQEPNRDWMMQGPESFEGEKAKKPGTWKIVGVVAAVVLLLGIAVGSYLIWGRDGAQSTAPDGPAAGAQEPAAEPPDREPPDPLAPADLGGSVEEKDVATFADLDAVGFLTDEELGALETAGAGEARLLITNFDEGKATVLVTRVGSPEQAAVARDELTALLLSFSFEPRSAPPGVNAVEILDRQDVPPTVRAVYVRGDVVVRLEMSGDDPEAVTARYEAVLDQQLEAMPADA